MYKFEKLTVCQDSVKLKEVYVHVETVGKLLSGLINKLKAKG